MIMYSSGIEQDTTLLYHTVSRIDNLLPFMGSGWECGFDGGLVNVCQNINI